MAVKIAGQECWLNFSVSALLHLGEVFGEKGTVAAVMRAILPDTAAGALSRETMANVALVAEELLAAGAEYRRVLYGEEVPRYTASELEVLLSSSEFICLHAAVIKAVQAGMERTVETEADPKKAKTTQGK